MRDVILGSTRSQTLGVQISQEAIDAFRDFLERNKDYLEQSAGVFHTDNHSNW